MTIQRQSIVVNCALVKFFLLAKYRLTTGTGDFNGDGKPDILWRKDTGATEVWQMNGSTVVSSTLTSVAADSSWKIAAPII